MDLAIAIFFAGAFFGGLLDLVLLLMITFAAGGDKKGRKDDEK